jgi:hypothetical protein
VVVEQLARAVTYGLVLRIDVLDWELPDRFAAERGVTVYEGTRSAASSSLGSGTATAHCRFARRLLRNCARRWPVALP